MDTRKLILEQQQLAKKLSLKCEAETPSTFAGVYSNVFQGQGKCAIVVCGPDLKQTDQAVHELRITDRYVPNFRAFREGKLIAETFAKLKNQPDISFFSGNGVLHPYKMGVASHLGILLDLATIGVAKDCSYGEEVDGFVTVGSEKRAAIVETKEHAKPVFVSPGHKMTLKKSVELTKSTLIHPHKLPEPLHLAQRLAKKKE